MNYHPYDRAAGLGGIPVADGRTFSHSRKRFCDRASDWIVHNIMLLSFVFASTPATLSLGGCEGEAGVETRGGNTIHGDRHLNSVRELALHRAPLSGTESSSLACLNQLALKTKNWTEASDTDTKSYRACLREFYASQMPSIQAEFDASLSESKQNTTTSKPTQTQIDAVRSFHQDRDGQVHVTWDWHTGTLRAVEGRLTAMLLSDSKASVMDAAKSLVTMAAAGCGFNKNSAWVPSGQQDAKSGSNHTLVFRHQLNGIDVLGHRLELRFGKARNSKKGFRFQSLVQHCERSPGLPQSTTPTLSQANAEKIASDSFAPLDKIYSASSKLRFEFIDHKPELVWVASIRKEHDAQEVRVNSHSGVIQGRRFLVSHGGSHSGDLGLTVRHPYGTSATSSAFSYVSIWQDSVFNTFLGWTDAGGTYTVSHPSSWDHSWNVYFAGSYARDDGTNGSDYEVLASFTAGTSYTFAEFTSDQTAQARAQVYYDISYAHDYLESALPGVTGWKPQNFRLPTSSPSACNGDCCGQGSGSPAGTIRLHGYCSNRPDRHARFRWLTVHEYGHTTIQSNFGVPCCGTPDCVLCRAWDEATADIISYSVNRFEALRSGGVFSGCGPGGGDNYEPNRTWDDDVCVLNQAGSQWDTGNIFAGAFVELHLQLGWKEALARILRLTDNSDINSLTDFVNGPSENDFYHKMLAADAEDDPTKPHQLTISQAFKRHDDTMTNLQFDWPDQLPGSIFPAYMVRPTNTVQTLTDGPDSHLPSLAIEHNKDRDYFFVYTWKDVRYTFRTKNLCVGFDPSMSWFRVINGTESAGQTSDNCGDPGSGLNSCVSIIAGSNAWGGVKVWATGENSSGCYQIEYSADDDAGASAQASRAVALDSASYYPAEWESAGDVDYYRIYVPDAGAGRTLHIETCEVDGSNPDTVTELFFEGDLATKLASTAAVDQTDDIQEYGGCGYYTSRYEYDVPAGKEGFYFLKVYEYGNNDTGTYKVRAWLDGGTKDVGGSSQATALEVSDSELTGRYLAGYFDSASDEDWFKVQLSENEHVTFHTGDRQGSTDTVMELWDDGSSGFKDVPTASLRWMLMDDDGGFEPVMSRIHFVAPRAGWYYVKLRAYSSSSLGPYTLYIQRMGNSAPAYVPRP